MVLTHVAWVAITLFVHSGFPRKIGLLISFIYGIYKR